MSIYSLAVNSVKKKLRKFHAITSKRIKSLGINLNKRTVRSVHWKLQNIVEWNWRRQIHGKISHAHSIFQIDTLILYSPYQSTSCLFVCKIDNLNLIKMEMQEDQYGQNNIEK